MILQGNVRGGIYPIVQQAYDGPIDGAKTCKQCGAKFVPSGQGNYTYCSDACRKEARKVQTRESHRRNKHRRAAERARRLKTT